MDNQVQVSQQKNTSLLKTTNLFEQIFPATDIQLTEISSELTIQSSVNSITLQNAAKELSPKSVKIALTKVVRWGLQFFHVSQPMTDNQIIAFVSDYFERYYTDTIDDLILMFKSARQGKYGKTFKMIDQTILFEWYIRFLNEKFDVKEDLIKTEIEEKSVIFTDVDAEIKKRLKKLREHIIYKESSEEEKYPSRRMLEKKEFFNKLILLAQSQSHSKLLLLRSQLIGNKTNYRDGLEIVCMELIKRANKRKIGTEDRK